MHPSDFQDSPDCRDVWFNALDPELRAALAASLRGKTPPLPYYRRKRHAASPWLLLLLGGIAAGAATLIWDGRDNHYGTRDFLLLTGAAGAIALGLLGLARCLALRRALPYPEGEFLFAGDILEVRRDRIRCWDLRQAHSARLMHHRSQGLYQFSTLEYHFNERVFCFRLRGVRAAETTAERHLQGQAALRTAQLTGDARTQATLDPLREVRVAGAWEEAGHRPKLRGRHLKDRTLARPVRPPLDSGLQVAVTGVICGLVAGTFVFYQARAGHDRELFAAARARGTVESLESYLKVGRRHLAEARALLPEAALRQAVAAGSVGALREVLRDYSGHPVTADAKAAIRDLYSRALAALTQHAKPECVLFLTRLLAWLEAAESPEIAVTFLPPGTTELTNLETGLKELDGFVKLPGRSFTPEACRSRESSIVHELQYGFNSIVEKDIIRLRHLGDGGDSADRPLTAPRIEIRYQVRPSGSLYVQKDPAGGFPGLRGLADPGRGLPTLTGSDRFAGVKFSFSIKLSVPGDDKPWLIPLEVSPAEEFTVRSSGFFSPDRESVYDAMAETAFARLTAKLSDELLSRPAAGDLQGKQ